MSDVAVFKIKNYDGKESYYSSSTHEYFRPIKSEREKLIERIKGLLVEINNGSSERFDTDLEVLGFVAERIVDAGWRPTND